MKSLYLILVGILLALIEATVSLHFFGVGLVVSGVAIIALTQILSGRIKDGTVIFFSGALIIDIFSPYRLGFVLLSYSIVYLLTMLLLARVGQVKNPLLNFVCLFLALVVLNIFQLSHDPLLIIFVLSILLNSLIALGITYFWQFFESNKHQIKLSDHVHFR